MKPLIKVIVILIVLLTLWQCVVLVFNPPFYILPSPLRVFVSLQEYQKLLWAYALVTFKEAFLGFLLGILLGTVTAILIHTTKFISHFLLPLVLVSQALPTFALAPILVLWFGYGEITKILTTAIMVFFPVASSFYDGLKKTPLEWSRLAESMCATRFKTIYHIAIPAALPQLASGVRIAAITAPLGAVVGEWVGSSQGLGYLMLNANARMQIDLMFGTLFILVVMALGMYFIVDRILQKLIWWTA